MGIVDHVDLPPSPRIFDKNHEILGFETYILYYPYYFLRVRGTDRKTQSPFKWIFFLLKASFKYLYTASHIIMEQYSYTLLFTSKDIWPCFPVIYTDKDFKKNFICDPLPH